MKIIDIFSLKDISYVPSARTCDTYAEAAAVCLENQGHKSHVIFFIQKETLLFSIGEINNISPYRIRYKDIR